MALHWPTFIKRTGSAIVFAIIMLVGLLWNQLAFMVLVSIIQVLCLRDYFRLMKKIDPEVFWPSWVPNTIQVVGLISLWAFSPVTWNISPISGSSLYFKLILFFPILILLITTLSKKTAWHAALQAFGGVIYIILPMILLAAMRDQSILLPLALILMIWTNDTMAYIVGSFIGKTPFSEISPKKTWEGTIGGALLTMGVAGLFGYFTDYYATIHWMMIALCAGIAGTMGDLLESKLKRMAGVKDSGNMMPGHGGAMDRFDSLLVATPFAFVYGYIFMPYVSLTIL
jgi:phosphatidate cytidylyltransferase